MHRDSVVRCFDFYPRPPRGGRRNTDLSWGSQWYISIHALREEGDQRRQPTGHGRKISIHALREEGDSSR